MSQPRAGSTLLQRIIAGHPRVQTSAEPWLMLHPAYALEAAGHEAEYGASLAHAALVDFLEYNIVRRDTGESYANFLKGPTQASRIKRPYQLRYDTIARICASPKDCRLARVDITVPRSMLVLRESASIPRRPDA